MKLKCKCGQVLTKDLYPTKQFGSKHVGFYDDEETVPHTESWAIKGSFYLATYNNIRKSYKKRYGSAYEINEADLVVPRPEYKTGRGCCDVWMWPVECPSCKVVVGEANLDCHCHKHIGLFASKVDRIYPPYRNRT